MKAIRERVRKTLTVSTDRSAIITVGRQKTFRQMTDAEFSSAYRLGKDVMESTNTGMKVVFATRLSDGVEVVIKSRDRSCSFKSANSEREWRSTTEVQMNMPKIETMCQIFDAIVTKDFYYVVMERVHGMDLFEQMASSTIGHLDAREIVRQILVALRALHGAGRIHKDLKLENVVVDMHPELSTPTSLKRSSSRMTSRHSLPGALVEKASEPMSPTLPQLKRSLSRVASRTSMTSTPSNPVSPVSPVEAKLIDFDTVEDWEPSSPKSKDVLGTDGYIAPEAYGGSYSPASDIYCVGVIMYKLLTKRSPSSLDMFDDRPGENWVGSPAMRRIQGRLKDAKIDFTRAPLDRFPAAAELVAHMLAYEPGDRPNAEEALRHKWFQMDPSELIQSSPQSPNATNVKASR